MNKDLITIVIPAYNVEEYLPKCIDSVINQTYSNLEIILVDDGSPDSCGKICDNYKKMDNRIKVIHKENGGLSDARNVAIDICKGKYITFIDSDDYVSKKYIENLYIALISNNADISTCDYISFSNKVEKKYITFKSIPLNNIDALENMLYQKNVTTCAWGKLYKTSLFKDIRYPKGKICEDLDTTYKLFAKSKKIVITNNNDYFYFQRPSSIINSKFNIKRLDALDFATNETKYIKKHFPSIINSAINREFMEAIFVLQKISISDLKKDYGKKISNMIKNNRKTVINDKKSRFLFRIYAFISYFGIYLLKIFLTILFMFK